MASSRLERSVTKEVEEIGAISIYSERKRIMERYEINQTGEEIRRIGKDS